MKYIKIINWEKFQHYTKRTPPWIKLHRDLLRNYTFECLQDDSKLLAIFLWLLASQLDNKIPADLKYLARNIPVKFKIRNSHLQTLVETGFIECYQDDSKMLASCKQNAIPETETETETETDIYLDNFEKARKKYPGNKRGLDTEFTYLKKTHKDWRQVVSLLLPAINAEIVHKRRLKSSDKFCPEWKNFKTWIYNRCWEMEYASSSSGPRLCKTCGKPATAFLDNGNCHACEWG